MYVLVFLGVIREDVGEVIFSLGNFRIIILFRVKCEGVKVSG